MKRLLSRHRAFAVDRARFLPRHLKQQIAHWGEVVRDNKIEAPTN